MVSCNCQQFIITRVVRNCQYQNGLWACLCRIALNALMGKDLAYTSVTSFEVFFYPEFSKWWKLSNRHACIYFSLIFPLVMMWLTCFKVLPYFHIMTGHNLELSANIDPFSPKFLLARYFITATQMKLRQEWWYLSRHFHKSILCPLTIFSNECFPLFVVPIYFSYTDLSTIVFYTPVGKNLDTKSKTTHERTSSLCICG